MANLIQLEHVNQFLKPYILEGDSIELSHGHSYPHDEPVIFAFIRIEGGCSISVYESGTEAAMKNRFLEKYQSLRRWDEFIERGREYISWRDWGG